jgi:3-oxoacyl-(acyl-carrier-protein) synthase
MERACNEAGVKLGDIDLIYASAREDIVVGKIEARAIESVFGKRLTSAPVVLIKSGLAESLGASSALQVAAAALSIDRSVIPPTIINCDRESARGDAACATSRQTRNVLINSFSNEGHLSCLVLKKI